ncbi:MAG: PrsW family intramembrane metalloprotease [Myxococcales bacterium]|nr:PrsW family intramembrane metalloprotease [Myxococcales bacterium]
MLSTLISTLLLSLLYLAIVRFVDMNEKEPLWAMLMVFFLGAGAAVVTSLVASNSLLGLSVWASASIKEVVKFLAIGAGVGVLVAYGQRRGWEEFNGTMDGIVYGTCGGLGFGVAEQLVNQLSFASITIPGLEVSQVGSFGKLALSGLSDGVVGAIIGAGFGLASEAKLPALRAIVPVCSLVGAVLADAGYQTLRRGNSLGDSGALRANLALGAPVLFIALVAVYALMQERRAIHGHLDDEVSTGALGASDLPLLKSVIARQIAYAKAFFSFKLGFYFGLRSLHNLQVQLAFAKARLAQESDPARRARVDSEVAKIRAAALAQRRSLGLEGGAS